MPSRLAPSLPVAKGLSTRLDGPEAPPAPSGESAWKRAILAAVSGFLLSFGAAVLGSIVLERAPAAANAATRPEMVAAGAADAVARSAPLEARRSSIRIADAPTTPPALAWGERAGLGWSSAEVVFAIADIRADWRAWRGKTLSIEGVVSHGAGGFVPHRNQFAMQDETGGLVVDDPDRKGGSRQPMMGERVRVIGRLADYRGTLQLAPAGPIEFLGTAQNPSPLPVGPGDFAEALEGMLLRVEGARIVGGGPTDATGANANIDIETPDGERVRLFLDADAKIPRLALPPTFAAQGILYPYQGPDAGAIGAPKWALYPRAAFDFLP